jgi:hypothetical protein
LSEEGFGYVCCHACLWCYSFLVHLLQEGLTRFLIGDRESVLNIASEENILARLVKTFSLLKENIKEPVSLVPMLDHALSVVNEENLHLD